MLSVALVLIVVAGVRTVTAVAAQDDPAPLRVVASVPNLAALLEHVGGDRVSVTTVLPPGTDPFSFQPDERAVAAVSIAELYVRNGFGMEDAWGLSMLKRAANRRILPSSKGYLDASSAVEPLSLPGAMSGRPTRNRADSGNPFYLLDPINGLAVAELLRAKLTEFRPADEQYFRARLGAFERRVKAALIGPRLAAKYRAEALSVLYARGQLAGFLASRGESPMLGGWLARLAPFQGVKVVSDRGCWPYFAARFGISVRSYLELQPGMRADRGHLDRLLDRAASEGVRLLLASSYSDPGVLEAVSKRGGLRIVKTIAQVGADPSAYDYVAMIDYNVSRLAEAFAAVTSAPVERSESGWSSFWGDLD